MKKILIILGTYLPGYKGGGPVTSIRNLVDTLGTVYEFQILTTDRDIGDTNKYNTILMDEWNIVGNAKIFYVPPKGFKMRMLQKLSKEVDLIYLCGCFNDYSVKTLFLKRLGLIQCPVIVASMGLFSEGAFSIKKSKKEKFIKLTKTAGLYKKIAWSATTEKEVLDIKKIIGLKAKCFIARDLPRKVVDRAVCKKKSHGSIKIVFLSRISPEKNLEYAIDVVCKLKGNIQFTIYGPVGNEEYWLKCLEKLNKMPSNIKWIYEGNLKPEDVIVKLEKQDLLLLPTLGENYGHVIQEALSAGCVTVISDKTPWGEIEIQKVGKIISLEKKQQYIDALQAYIDMDTVEFQKLSDLAVQYAVQYSNNEHIPEGFRNMFDSEK